MAKYSIPVDRYRFIVGDAVGDLNWVQFPRRDGMVTGSWLCDVVCLVRA